MSVQGPVTIIGDGGWGTAVATVLCSKNLPVTIWGHDPAYLEEMAATRTNRLFLPGVQLPGSLRFEPDLERALAGAALVITAVPTKFLRSVVERCRGLVPPQVGVVSLTKGVEQETLLRPSEILAASMGAERIAVLSGPSHAEEVAHRRPTTVVVSSTDDALARQAQATLMTPFFRLYTSPDTVGVELGGAIKNVIALAAGICTGLELGDNAMAALLTRGLAEMTRLGVALGADARTFSGLSGMGDLVVTCTSPFGRNRAVGIQIGQGRSLEQILASMEQVAEGVTTAVSARALARRSGVEMPIVEQVWRVLYEGRDPREGVTELMTRQPRPE